MTAVEAEMEEQIAKQAHQPNEALKRAQELRRQKKVAAPRRAKMDRDTETAMNLGQ